ncbi:MAG: helix-turn-helix transcriptional regulator [Sphingomonas sp.]|uniref:helix-turn-helix domain-containing protein n=1 Tax=Sphingomonas sp. TaxID=28214 RepID=UPI001ACF2B6A|nr:helix-turn-helix transcriptional regulator [Sphingomonas sp.]MBN8808404.1 helix-turn-helix transcriptional regulator [Sphingomonas sp.]
MSHPIEQLSPREREILELAGRGLRSKEIARELGISPRTVDTHIARAISTLGARSRLEAVRVIEQVPAYVDLPTEPPEVASSISSMTPVAPERSPLLRWASELSIFRNGKENNELTVVRRLAWILAGALAIIFIFAQLTTGLRVAQEIALGIR